MYGAVDVPRMWKSAQFSIPDIKVRMEGQIADGPPRMNMPSTNGNSESLGAEHLDPSHRQGGTASVS